MDDFTGHCGGGRYPLLSTIVQTLRQAGRTPKRRRTDDYADRAPNEYRAVPAQRRQNEYTADRPNPTRRRPEPSFKAANDDYDDFEAADSYRNKNDYLPVRMENMNGRSEYEHDRVTNNGVRQRMASRKEKDALILPPRTQPPLYENDVYSDDVSGANDVEPTTTPSERPTSIAQCRRNVDKKNTLLTDQAPHGGGQRRRSKLPTTTTMTLRPPTHIATKTIIFRFEWRT